MTEFAYNHAKNANIGHISFELNCIFHPRVLFEEDVDFYSKSYSANKLANELRELIEIRYQNLLHAQELQKRAHEKKIKDHSYVPDEKVLLNS